MMNLFNQEIIQNLLPNDGELYYYGKIFSPADQKFHFSKLLHNLEWKHDEAVIFGKKVITKRKTAWYGNSGYSYTYSNIIRYALPWTAELLLLKNIAEEKTGALYNSCLCNLYHSGDEGVSWHSDDETSLQKGAAIAAMSFGAERKFSFKHKQKKQTVSLIPESGSLLVMKGNTQTFWLHSLPKTKKITTPRISLTFRSIVI